MNVMLPQNIGSFIWHFLKPHKGVVLLYICIAFMAGCWGPFNSLLIKQIINILSNHNIENSNISSLAWPATALVLNFIVFDNVTWRSIGYLNYKYQLIIKNKVLSETFACILGSSYQFFHDNLSGRVSNQIKTLADNIERILHRIAADFIRGFSMLVVALWSMYLVNPLFFYTLAIWFICFSFFSLYMSKTLVSLSDRYAESESLISGLLVDSVSNVNNIRMFARSKYEISRLEDSLLSPKMAFQKNEWFLIKLNWGQGILIALMMAVMVYFLIYLYGLHKVTIGDFALILGLSMEMGHISWYTMSQVDEFNQAIGKCKQSLMSLIVPRILKIKMMHIHYIFTKAKSILKKLISGIKVQNHFFKTYQSILRQGKRLDWSGSLVAENLLLSILF